MANKILIDSRHREEVRMALLRDGRVESFDFESPTRRQQRGNIFLAKIARVEPSLQAAFVDYGAERHGFLAFSEIHPDYYQIPVADRRSLIDDEAANADADPAESSGNGGPSSAGAVTDTAGSDDDLGANETLEELRRRRASYFRRYKIQEVIKRRQIVLVQLVKEERGNKGAALTTYLSLAGRYAVLMPNTVRGGGISRRITDGRDRKRMRDFLDEIAVPEGMGVIFRTAAAGRTRSELRRDVDYLLRSWDAIRELTLKSIAPLLVHEEGSMVKRAIRDRYSKDVDAIIVSGEDVYREAKQFMRLLMPSHARNVQLYRDESPLFSRYGIEKQIEAMYSPKVELESGGYIVINQTEALVAIDVNSGRATRESHIEDTALNTNLEAAAEIARQLQLRDLAGLIVIDFIDMDEKTNSRQLEKRFKDFMRNDRARVQIGSISNFGLLEMSRQRMQMGVIESSTVSCHRCDGLGYMRATPSIGLAILRECEEILLAGSLVSDLKIITLAAVADFLLNQKRSDLLEIEDRFSVSITVSGNEVLDGGSDYQIVKDGKGRKRIARPESVELSRAGRREVATVQTGEPTREEGESETEALNANREADGIESADKSRRGSRRGRRGGRRSRRSTRAATDGSQNPAADLATENGLPDPTVADTEAVAPTPSARIDDRRPHARTRRRADSGRSTRSRNASADSGMASSGAERQNEAKPSVQEVGTTTAGVELAEALTPDSSVLVEGRSDDGRNAQPEEEFSRGQSREAGVAAFPLPPTLTAPVRALARESEAPGEGFVPPSALLDPIDPAEPYAASPLESTGERSQSGSEPARITSGEAIGAEVPEQVNPSMKVVAEDQPKRSGWWVSIPSAAVGDISVESTGNDRRHEAPDPRDQSGSHKA